MKVSELDQRVLDELFNALSLLFLLSNEEIERIALAIEDFQNSDKDSHAMLKAVAKAIRMVKE